MPIISQPYTYEILFQEAEDESIPDTLRLIALGQIVEKLRLSEDQDVIFYNENLEIAEKVTRQIAEFPLAKHGLLDSAVKQITKRLRPNQDTHLAASMIELKAAETAAEQAQRDNVNDIEALKPLIHILGTLYPDLYRSEIIPYANAAETLLVNVSQEESEETLSVCLALSIIAHPKLEADDRLGRLADIFIKAPNLSKANRNEVLQAFCDTAGELFATDKAYGEACFAHQRLRFEEHGCPELIMDVIDAARARLDTPAYLAKNPGAKPLHPAAITYFDLLDWYARSSTSGSSYTAG